MSFIALITNLILFIQIHRKSYISYLFLPVKPQAECVCLCVRLGGGTVCVCVCVCVCACACVCMCVWLELRRRLDERGVQLSVGGGGVMEGRADGRLIMMAILTVFDQWSIGEMVSTESDQRLLASEIGSDHSLITVWTKVWIWIWTMVWSWSDQNFFGLESLIRDPISLESLIRGYLGLKSLIRDNFGLESLIRG